MYKYIIASLSIAATVVACQSPPPTPAIVSDTTTTAPIATPAPDTPIAPPMSADTNQPIRHAKPTLAPPQLTFEKTTFNYGKVKSTDTIRYQFAFTNTGGKPLEISRVTTSWGSAVPSYSKLPIAAGEKGTIDINITLIGKLGKLSTTISVYSNASEEPQTLTIEGEAVSKQQ